MRTLVSSFTHTDWLTDWQQPQSCWNGQSELWTAQILIVVDFCNCLMKSLVITIQLIILLTNWAPFVTWLLNRSPDRWFIIVIVIFSRNNSIYLLSLLFKLNCRNPHLVSSSNPDNLNNPGSDSDQQSCHLQDKHPHFRPRNYLVSEEKYFIKPSRATTIDQPRHLVLQ